VAKKLTRKEKIALQKKEAVQHPFPKETQHKQRKKPTASKKANKLKLSLGIIVGLLAFVLYANTLTHDYALDDYGIIPENTITRKGFDGVGEIFKTSYRSGRFTLDFSLYRPLSKAMFAIEWGISPNNPQLSHAVNVFLFAITGYLLFIALALYIRKSLLIPFITSILFVAHPIHTEAVANIKGRDEILCFLFFIVTAIYIFHYVHSGKLKHILIATVSFFLSFLSKESAITFLAVIPLMLYFFTDVEKSKYVAPVVMMVIVAGIFLLIRSKVLGPNKDSPTAMIDNFMATMSDGLAKRASAIFIMGVYLKLLFFPHPLLCDGSYNHFPQVGVTDWQFLVSLLIYAALAVYALMRFKQKDSISFGIIYFFVTASIVSNVIITIGTNYGERLMYAPSLGFCIAIAALFVRIFKIQEEETGIVFADVKSFLKNYTKPIALTAVVFVLFGFQTFTRNMEWENNFTLYSTDLKHAPNSARIHFYLGNQLSMDDYLATITDSIQKRIVTDSAIAELNRALEIYPAYSDAVQKIAQIYLNRNDTANCRKYYERVMGPKQTNATYWNNYGNFLFRTGKIPMAKEAFENAIKYSPYYAHAYNNLASVYGAYGESTLNKAKADPSKQNELVTEARGYFEQSVNMSLKAISLDRDYYQAYQTAAITYGFLGNTQKQKEYTALYQEAKQRSGQ
jgi:Tfp pilus assembly protein PilF